jgi:hypothetical protein
MGLIKKVLYVMTGGLSGLVFKDDSSKQRAGAAKTAARAQAQPKPRQKTTRQKAKKTSRPRPAKASVQAAASKNGTASELERLSALHAQGVITMEEFAAAKAKILGTSAKPTESSRAPSSTYPSVEANVAAARQLADLTPHRDTSVGTLRND